MTFAGSLFLIAIGAILRFATHFHIESVDLQTVGVILMIVGGVGFLIAIAQSVVWSRRSREPEAPPDERRPPDEYRDPRY